MRVAIFSDSFTPYVSGVVRSVELLRAELSRRGHDVAVFAPAYPGTPAGTAGLGDAPWAEAAGVYRFPSLPAPRYPQFRVAVPWGPRLREQLRQFGPDVVHLHSPFVLGRVGLRAARALGVPVCLTVHTQYEVYLRQYAGAAAVAIRPFLLRSLRSFYDACDLVIAPTEQVRAALAGLGVRARVEVLPGGVPVAHFAGGRRAVGRDRWQLPRDGPVLLYVGRLSVEKNLRVLLEAFRRLADREPRAVLVLAGDGPLRPALQAEASGPLAGRLWLPGLVGYEELPDLLAAADIFVFPSRTETQGLAVVEAMAAGLPVVAVGSPEVAEVVGDAGVLVPDDPDALAAAALRLLGDAEAAAALAERARRRAEAFGLPAVVDRLLALYASLGMRARAGA